MSVAKCLGVDDLDAPNMQRIRAEWPRWQDAEPALTVVADIARLQICEHDPADGVFIAATNLRRVERESLAELGLGELAKRRDPTWASAVLIERYDETIPAEESDVEEPQVQLIELLRRALDSGALSDQDRDLLLDLALAANLAGAPLRRGRAGLTTPSAAQLMSQDHALAARTIRRHAADALDRLGEVARRSGLAM